MNEKVHIKQPVERVRFEEEEIYGRRPKQTEEEKIIRTLEEAKSYYEKDYIEVNDAIRYLQTKRRNKETVLDLRGKMAYLSRIIMQFQKIPDQATAEMLEDIANYLDTNLK